MPHVDWRPQAGNFWRLWRNESGNFDYDQVRLSVLMDIREELKPLRNLNCANFQRIPAYLRRIAGGGRPSRSKRLETRARDHHRSVVRARSA